MGAEISGLKRRPESVKTAAALHQRLEIRFVSMQRSAQQIRRFQRVP